MIRNSLLAIVCLAVLGAPVASASECHGPVGRNETLWPIALRLRPDPSISPQRTMLALLEANPEAFRHANVNALNAGSTLCLGPGDLFDLDEEAAIAEVGRHNREWKSGRAQAGGASHAPADAVPGARAGEEPAASLPADDVAELELRLAHLEVRIGDLESGPGPERIAHAMASLEMRVARIEDRIRVLAAMIEEESEAPEHQAMEPMPTPAPQAHDEAMEPMPTPPTMEPMPTPAPQAHEAMEPMPTPAPQAHEAMEPMPTPAPQAHEAMEPMPTPAPQAHEAMEPMPTPAPQAHEAMEPMPTPAPQAHEAMEPMPTPAPQAHEAMEPMPTPAPQAHEAMEPMPPAPHSGARRPTRRWSRCLLRRRRPAKWLRRSVTPSRP